MFSGARNPFVEPVAKATDEKQTQEDWGSLLTIWEKVNAEGETGARNCVAAIVQRLQHRNANVQLFSLTNCGKPLHREIAGKTFTDALKRLITDRNTHEKVKQRIAGLIKEWTQKFERDTSLGIMGETYDVLKAKGVRFDEPPDEGPPPISDDVLKREEEELQRAIAESEREAKQRDFGPTGYQPTAVASTSQKPLPEVETVPNGPYPPLQIPRREASPTPASDRHAQPAAPTRVRAMYDFDPDPDQPGELPLMRGDVVKVIDAAYQEWWRGELRGRVGIFPVTYVEVIPEPTPDMLLAEAQYEAHVFSQAGEVDRLLHMLQSVNPELENIGDNDELSDLYQKCLMLRPKVLKLVEKYTSKKNELLDINNRFMSAKTDYEAMLDDSWRQHHAAQAQSQQSGYGAPHQQQAYPGYAHPNAGAPPSRQSTAQYYAPPQPQHQAASQAQTDGLTGPPQPFYDQATGQWFWPPGYVPDESQAAPPPPQQYQRPAEAPPTAQLASMHV